MFKRSVFSIAPSRGHADHIVNNLKGAEIANTEISLLFLDRRVGSTAGAAESSGEVRGVMAWVAGIGALVVRGVDPLIAAGPIAAAMGHETLGGIAEGLIDFGIPRQEAGRYEQRIEDGQTLIAVHSGNPDKIDRAREIFAAGMAADICTMMQVSRPKPASRFASGMSRAFLA